MMRRWAGTWCGVGVAGLALLGAARADEFAGLDGPMLTRLLKGADVAARPDLGLGEIGAMPAWLKDARSALVLARTDRGNPARLLLVPELRKPPASDPPAEPIPVVVVERLDTFDAGDLATRLATRREVVLFDGMPLDLDTGQVVPAGQGGDIVFRIAHGEPRLEAVGPAQLYALNKAPAFPATAIPRPSPGRSILAGDFAGRYRLFANGQWSGTLDLAADGKGVVTGQFRSDLHGTAYAVTGQVAADVPGLVRFAIALPRARQEFDGYLFGEGKGAMAGTVSLLDRTYGFFAVRAGGAYAPEGADLGPLQAGDQGRPGRITLRLGADGSITRDGQPVALDKLADLVAPAPDAPPWVVIVAADEATVASLDRVTAALRSGGIATIRLAPAPAAP